LAIDTRAVLAGLRRTLIAWAALAGLLAAPVAETLHEFTHARPASSDTQKKPGAVKPACEICAAFAAMGHALSTRPTFEVTRQASQPRIAFTPLSRPTGQRHTYRERAPPHPSPSA
jgi:hypothetical protein